MMGFNRNRPQVPQVLVPSAMSLFPRPSRDYSRFNKYKGNVNVHRWDVTNSGTTIQTVFICFLSIRHQSGSE